MELRHLWRSLSGTVAAALGCLLLTLAAAAVGAVELPPWQSLVFVRSQFGITARSHVELVLHPGREDAWLLVADSSIRNNIERVDLALDAESLAVLTRTRFSSGRNQRFKSFDYLPGHILRLRREPPGDPGTPPPLWPQSSRREIAYPPGGEDLVLTEAYALLPLAWRLRDCPPTESLDVAVHTDFNFYRVRLTAADGPEIPADYTVAGSGERVQGRRATRAVELQVEPLGVPEEERDFSLLGLEDGISILFDAHTGIPLQLRGQAPRVGRTSIDLREVALRKPAT